MADELVKLLNSYGYQPVFLPRTNVEPPELYTFAEKRLIRRGPLKDFLPAVEQMQPTRGSVAAIEHRQTSKKDANASVAFLANALRALGISAIPKLDLSFTGTKELVFSFSEVSYCTVDPSRLDKVLQQFATEDSIPEEYVRSGRLHIVYEYLYAKRLLLRRADGQSFKIDVSGSVGEYVDLGAGGHVEGDGQTVVSFTPSGSELPAFAFKAGRLERIDGKWLFQPEVVMRGVKGAKKPFLIARSVVLIAEDAEPESPRRKAVRSASVTEEGNRAEGVLDAQVFAPSKRFRGAVGPLAVAPGISPQVVKDLQPYVINLSQGRFSTEGAFTSSPEQVDRIIEQIREYAAKGGHLALYAHGGLTPEDAALRSAHMYYRWWLDNGVYPIYFVWETGVLDTICQFLSGAMFRTRAQKRMRDVWDWTTDPVVEVAARAAGGVLLWSGMKRGAELAGYDDSGTVYFLRKLALLCKELPKLNVHAVGHSAGSIFHAYVLPAARALGISGVQSLHLLAPAAQVKLFRDALLPLWRDEWIADMTMYTMRQSLERADNCAMVYRKSLLYLVFHALEVLPNTAILGLQDCVTKDERSAVAFGLKGGANARSRIVWSESNDGPSSASHSRTHGGFDDDPATMESVLRRILRKADTEAIVRFPTATKAQRAGSRS